MAFSLIPTEKKFFTLFEAQAAYSVEASRTFAVLAKDWGKRTLDFDAFARLSQIEKDADKTTHEINDLLNRTFITPLDREDIYRLAGELDDVIDLIESVGTRMKQYHVEHSTEDLARMADLLVSATETLSKAVKELRTSEKGGRLNDYCVEVHRLENIGDDYFGDVISKLFEGKPDPLETMKWKEIYEGIEAAIDRCEDVAETIEAIVVKRS